MSSGLVWAGPLCPEKGEETLFITAPASGFRTARDSVMFRGYLCDDHPLVELLNTTTHASTLITTKETCTHEGCVFGFMTFVENLTLGTNHFVASVPGSNPLIEEDVDVIKTALTFLGP